MQFHKLHIFFIFSLIISGCNSKNSDHKWGATIEPISYLPKFEEPTLSFIKEKQKESLDFYYEFMNPERFSGMFLVAKNGKIIFEKVNGFLNYEENKKLNASTPIHLASISKVATALATMRLVDKGKINLEDDIRKYLPTIPYKGVTVRMLLNHRSGIPYYGYFSEGIWNKKFIMRNKDVLKMINKHKFPLNYPAGTHFAYCNTNYALLALIIEKASEKKFPVAMKELIFEPLEMENSFIMDKPEKINEVSPSYNSRYVMQAVDFLDGVYGDKNMYSTARDILKMDIATYSKDFLSEKARKEIYRGYSYERAGARNYGL